MLRVLVFEPDPWSRKNTIAALQEACPTIDVDNDVVPLVPGIESGVEITPQLAADMAINEPYDFIIVAADFAREMVPQIFQHKNIPVVIALPRPKPGLNSMPPLGVLLECPLELARNEKFGDHIFSNHSKHQGDLVTAIRAAGAQAEDMKAYAKRRAMFEQQFGRVVTTRTAHNDA